MRTPLAMANACSDSCRRAASGSPTISPKPLVITSSAPTPFAAACSSTGPIARAGTPITARSTGTLDLDRLLHRQLHRLRLAVWPGAGVDLFDVLERGVQADALADVHRAGEAHPVEPIVDRHAPAEVEAHALAVATERGQQ